MSPENLIVIAIAAMLTLALGIIFFVVYYQKKIITFHQQKEKELTEAAINAEEEERSRIASELHDDVGATLASVRLYMHNTDKDGEGLAQSQQLLDDSIHKVRNLSHRLQPVTLQHLGLEKALQSFFDTFNKSGAISISYTSTTLPPMDDNTALGIYRIIQELVNNTLKHAGAQQIQVSSNAQNGQLQMQFTHNGDGITEERFQEYIYKKNATGLKNIVNRLKVLNGSISFNNENELYHTHISIPI